MLNLESLVDIVLLTTLSTCVAGESGKKLNTEDGERLGKTLNTMDHHFHTDCYA